jgi:hypothetical protein
LHDHTCYTGKRTGTGAPATPEVVQAQQLLARQQLAVAMDRARTAATRDAAPAALESE